MAKNLLDGKPKVQLSLDLQTMADAVLTAEIAVRAGVGGAGEVAVAWHSGPPGRGNPHGRPASPDESKRSDRRGPQYDLYRLSRGRDHVPQQRPPRRREGSAPRAHNTRGAPGSEAVP